uniref:Uncharacterized protein n=1 Tax=Opuntia streptacantha TaxID=393608 RepID=A0A7C8ZUW1_OPUST
MSEEKINQSLPSYSWHNTAERERERESEMSGCGKRASGAPNGASNFRKQPQPRGPAKNKILGNIVRDIFTTKSFHGAPSPRARTTVIVTSEASNLRSRHILDLVTSNLT